MLQAVTRPKPCRVCRQDFTPVRPLQVVCGLKCARSLPVATRKAEKESRKATRAALEALKPLSYWVQQAQTAFNAWIRERDKDRPCISCGRFHVGSWDAGHYLTTGARPELRFDEANVHRQCVPCNQHLHGNLVMYRVGLLGRIGLAELTRLEGPHPPRRYRVDDLKAIRADYRARLKATHPRRT